MRKDMEQKVEALLSSFDKAVKQSSTRENDGNGQQKRGELDLDVAHLIAGEADSGPADKPSCRPWDYAAFAARVSTFTPLNWFSKPAFASPPMCARYGWINTGRDKLSCQCCGSRTQFRDTASASKDNGNGDAAADAAEEVIAVLEPVSSSSFLSRLKSQHHDLCPWNGNVCPQEFLQLPPMTREDLVAEFLERLESIVSGVAVTALPEVSLPSSFEEACPGGLSTLAVKARAVMVRRSPLSTDTRDAAAATPAVAAEEAASANIENEGNPTGGNKRQREGGTAASAVAGGDGALSAFGDAVVGAAAALAVFGWRSATPARSPADGGSSSNTSIVTGADGNAQSPQRVTNRLTCALCKRRVVTDNFLSLEVGKGSGSGAGSGSGGCGGGGGGGDAAVSSPGGAGRSGKRRRLSGGGTPLKPMDLAMEHRSYCPWANVHPPVEREADVRNVHVGVQGAVPGWRQTLEALLEWVDPATEELEQPSEPSISEEAEGFGDADNGKAGEALQKVQKVLGVLMRY